MGLDAKVGCNCFKKGKSRTARIITRGCIDVMRKEINDLI